MHPMLHVLKARVVRSCVSTQHSLVRASWRPLATGSPVFAYPLKAGAPVEPAESAPTSHTESHSSAATTPPLPHAPTAHQVADYVHRAELIMMRSMYFEDLRRFRLLVAGAVGTVMFGLALFWSQIKALFVVRAAGGSSLVIACPPTMSACSPDEHERVRVCCLEIRGRPRPGRGRCQGRRRHATD